MQEHKLLEKSTNQAIIQLFKDGLDINTIIDDCNTTVLHEACHRERYEVAKYLIDQGAEFDTMTTKRSGSVAQTPYKDGQPPLFAAIYQGNIDIVRLLLDHGAQSRPEEPKPESQVGRVNIGVGAEYPDGEHLWQLP